MHAGLSKRLGALQSYQSDKQVIVGETDYGHFRITTFSDSIINISVSKSSHFENFSYALSASPQRATISLHDNPDRIVVRTAALELDILKNPVSFIFKNLDGIILNKDEENLGTSWIGEQVTTYKTLQEGERFIGLGEKTGPLDRRGSGYQNWNSDAYAYHAGSDPLYCSIPFFIGLHHLVQYGIFLDNSHKTFFNFGASNNRFSSFGADAGEMNYYFIGGNSVAEIIEHYTWLTGRIPLPPKWSIGYQQCRYSYYPDKEVLAIANTFREKKIPADAIALDIHYMDKYKIFTWDQEHFSDPKALISKLKSLGFEVVLMCDPGIKIEKGYEPYEDGLKKDVFVKYPDGENYAGQVWPGWCHFPDFTNPKTRKWWTEKLAGYSDLGVEGYWNDMNEIATWGNMVPDNLEFYCDGNQATTRMVRNLYGFQMARSSYEGAKDLLSGKRPFNLTRSGYSGVQRYAAVWTGDNVSYDEHMMLGVRIVNSLGLSGVAFAGYDIGGFVGEASTKLFARWISLGAFSPFFRGHTMINTKDAEPWSFGEEVEQISRNYIRLRYQLLPYIYSLFYESSRTGMPVQRSLAIEYPRVPQVFRGQFQHQYLFGPFIMVAPVESSKEYLKVLFPEGQWYSLFNGTLYSGGQEVIVECPIHQLPVFIKGGALLPMQGPVQNTKETVDELRLHVYHGSTETHFEFYEDDGSTFQYEAGSYASRTMSFSPTQKKVVLEKQEGSYHSPLRTVRLVLHGFPSLDHVHVNGDSKRCTAEGHSFFLALEKYDPINDPDNMGGENVMAVQFLYSPGRIEVSW